MHPKYEQAMSLTGKVIGAAIEVHRHFGPGLLESIYEWALIRELELAGISCLNQEFLSIQYKGATKTEQLRFDVLVEACILVEVKSVEAVLPIHKAQLLSYLKLMNIPVGLVINFHEQKLVDGVSRLFLPSAADKSN